MFQVKCDKCKRVTEDVDRQKQLPKDWRTVGYQTQIKYTKYVYFQVCPACAKLLKLPDEKVESLEDRLLDIISDLVADAVDNQ